MKGIRDHIAHGYFEIDADVIYNTVKEDLFSLLEATRFLYRKYFANKIVFVGMIESQFIIC